MRAFITGATGFIGRHLVAELVRRGWSVHALVRHPARAAALPRTVTIVRGDIHSEQALAQGLRDIDVVFHLAATIEGPWPVHERVTVEGTRRLLQLSAQAAVRRFVLVSSLAVYDKRRLEDGADVDEDWPQLPADASSGPYARARVETESIARAIESERLAVSIVRLGLVYGAERLTFMHLGELLGERRIAVGPPSLRLPLIEVGSAVDALIRAGCEPLAAGRIYHAVDTNEVSRADYVRMLAALSGHRFPVSYLPLWPVTLACRAIAAAKRIAPLRGLPALSAQKFRTRAVEARYDTARLERETGWTPQPSVAAGLTRALGASSSSSAAIIERVGLIGAGVIARLHLDALKRLRNVRVVGIFDTRFEAAQALGAQAGVRAFDDPLQFWREARPDIVHVLTPPSTHAAIAREALERGVHVLLEKPAVSTGLQCDALLAVARARDLTVGVDENVAWDPLVQRACGLKLWGVLGDLVHVDVFMGFDVRRSRIMAETADSWVLQLPGALLEDLLPHPLSVAMRIAGRELTPTQWRCLSTGRLPVNIPDELRLSCAGRGNVTVDIALSLTSRPDDFLVAIHGTRASIRLDLQNMLMDAITPVPGPRAVARGLRTLRSGTRILGQTIGNAFMVGIGRRAQPGSPVHLLRAHYAALAAGRELPAPLAQARAIVDITRAIWPLTPADAGGGQHAEPRYADGGERQDGTGA